MRMLIEHVHDLRCHARRQGNVQQSAQRLSDESRPDHQNVDGHPDRDQRVENVPTGEQDQENADDHPHRSPDISEQVVAVSPQCGRAMLAASPYQHQSHHQIDRGGHGRDHEANPEVLQHFRAPQARHRRHQDRRCGGENHESFDATGQVFGFPTAEVMGAVGRLGRCFQCHEGDDCGYHVDDRFDRIRQQAHRPGE